MEDATKSSLSSKTVPVLSIEHENLENRQQYNVIRFTYLERNGAIFLKNNLTEFPHGTISRWTAFVQKQTSTAMQVLTSGLVFNGPAKSKPVLMNDFAAVIGSASKFVISC